MKLITCRTLSDLEVADLNYRQSRLGVAMMGVASRLRTLTMDHVYGWDTTDLRGIGQYCGQLGALHRWHPQLNID